MDDGKVEAGSGDLSSLYNGGAGGRAQRGVQTRRRPLRRRREVAAEIPAGIVRAVKWNGPAGEVSPVPETVFPGKTGTSRDRRPWLPFPVSKTAPPWKPRPRF